MEGGGAAVVVGAAVAGGGDCVVGVADAEAVGVVAVVWPVAVVAATDGGGSVDGDVVETGGAALVGAPACASSPTVGGGACVPGLPIGVVGGRTVVSEFWVVVVGSCANR